MNNYYNYKKWRLAHIPRELPYDPAYGEDIGPGRIELPDNYTLHTKPSFIQEGKVDITLRRNNRHPYDVEENHPYISLTVPQGTVRTTARLLHHLVREHNNLLPSSIGSLHDEASTILHSPEDNHGFISSINPSISRYEAKEQALNDAEHRIRAEEAERGFELPQEKKDLYRQEARQYLTSSEARPKLPLVKVGGNIETEQDIAKVLSNAFSGIIQHHLLHNTGTIQHPGKDHLMDSTGTDDNRAIVDKHREMLEKYLLYHLKNPQSNVSYNSFLDYHARSPEEAAVSELLSRLLRGHYSIGKAPSPRK